VSLTLMPSSNAHGVALRWHSESPTFRAAMHTCAVQQASRNCIAADLELDLQLQRSARYCCVVAKSSQAMSDVFRAGLANSGIREELDLLDKVRQLLKDEDDIHLPGMVVVGNTSVGKSSVLESISGVEFPKGSDVTTTCPIRLRLRDSSVFAAKVNGRNINDNSLISQEIFAAMTHAVNNRPAHEARSAPGFAGAVIEVELNEPGLPDLTLMDLPGILNSGTAKTFVKSLIQQHISRKFALYCKRWHTVKARGCHRLLSGFSDAFDVQVNRM